MKDILTKTEVTIQLNLDPLDNNFKSDSIGDSYDEVVPAVALVPSERAEHKITSVICIITID